MPTNKFQRWSGQGAICLARQFGAIVLRANPDGSMVQLRDVARVEIGAEY